MKKLIFPCFLCLFLLTACSRTEPHFAVIPHFMLNSAKVDEFYAFLKDKRYSDKSPEQIIIISPNHFNTHSQTPQTICETSQIFFKDKKYILTPFPGISCSESIFYQFGSIMTTREHGIGEHLQRISKYFPDTDQIFPLILPTHLKQPILTGQTHGQLWIASVDFSHYLLEDTALSNDEISIQTLKSGTGEWSDFRSLDVDCPACLFLISSISQKEKQKADIRYRDSSSTIIGHDMGPDNTSRVFVFRE